MWLRLINNLIPSSQRRRIIVVINKCELLEEINMVKEKVLRHLSLKMDDLADPDEIYPRLLKGEREEIVETLSTMFFNLLGLQESFLKFVGLLMLDYCLRRGDLLSKLMLQRQAEKARVRTWTGKESGCA